MTDPFALPERRPTGAGHTEVWVAVAEFTPAEFTPAGTPNSFRLSDLDALIGELALWQPAGLWSDDRYAVQLRIAAHRPDEAVRVALDCHRRALRALGLAPSGLVRVEVLAAEEMERGWALFDEETTSAAGSGVHCLQVFVATRALVASATAAEVVQAVDAFVVAIGARVQRGPSRHLDGTTDVDLVGVDGQVRHATAEAMSVAGLLLEHALPGLVVDAGRALARLRTLPVLPRAGAAVPGAFPMGRTR